LLDKNIICCENCGWKWSINIGGKNPYLCHKCGYENNSYLAGFKKSKWNEPYKKKRTTLDKKLNKKPGVYLIKSKQTGEIKYVGHSTTNLKRTLYRHFQNWNDRAQERYVYDKNRYLIRVIETTSKRAPELEKYLIAKYNPKDNRHKYPNTIPVDYKQELENAEFFNAYTQGAIDTPF